MGTLELFSRIKSLKYYLLRSFHSSSVVETSKTSTESATSNTEAYTTLNKLEDAGVQHPRNMLSKTQLVNNTIIIPQ